MQRRRDGLTMCKHDNVTFHGLYSYIGAYHCNDCGEEINPLTYAKLKGIPNYHIPIENYPEEHREKIREYWHQRCEGINEANT